ncbi:MAG: 50S ribosomal protein L6 [Armatimonadota bacterium]|nr:50S ribosomal protein L6 [Dehalococcoidia bacterium]
MSRIGKLPITVPSGVDVELGDGSHVRVRGPKGTLERDLPRDMTLTIDDGTVSVARPSDAPQHRALHGLTRTLVYNMVAGVSEGFTKTLEVQGVGYRAQMQGKVLALQLGYSHPITVEPPEGITLEVEGNRVRVSGIDKELVGQVAANIRALRPPQVYTGKGVRYEGERVRRKAGKAGKGAGRR